MLVAVTGASGFLGGHLIRVLRDRGMEVRAVVRREAAAEALGALGFQTALADLADADALTAAFSGCDAVVSNAAQLDRRGANLDTFRAANVDGARRVAEAAVRAGVSRFVQISSVAVLASRLGRNGSDTPMVGPTGWAPSFLVTDKRYGRTKSEGETASAAVCETAGIRFTALRPGPIYGSGDTVFFGLYRRWLDWPVIALPTASVPHVHAGDVALAAALALGHAAPSRAYTVTGENNSLFAGMGVLKRIAGRGPLLLPLWTPVGLSFDDSAARTELGWSSRSLQDGFTEALSGDVARL